MELDGKEGKEGDNLLNNMANLPMPSLTTRVELSLYLGESGKSLFLIITNGSLV